MHKHRQTTIDRAIAQNIYVTDKQVAQSNTLAEVALDFVQSYKGANTFVQDIAVRLADQGNLSIPQLRGALNVMVAEAKMERNRSSFEQRITDACKPLVLDFTSKAKSIGTIRPSSSIIVDSDDTSVGCPECGYDPCRCQPLQAPSEAPQPTMDATPVVVPDDLATSPHKNHKVANGIYTVILNDAGDYRTLRLIDAPESFGKPGTQIAQYLSGADNESSYTGFAFVNGNSLAMWRKFQWTNPKAQQLQFALIKLLNADDNGIEYGKAYALKSGNCFVCNRRLTTPDSIKSGIGPICAAKLGIDQQNLIKSNRPSSEKVNPNCETCAGEGEIPDDDLADELGITGAFYIPCPDCMPIASKAKVDGLRRPNYEQALAEVNELFPE